MSAEHGVSGIQHKARWLGRLTAKVIEEMQDPNQLFDPARRAQLIQHGLASLRGIMAPIDQDIQRLQENLRASLQWGSTKDGIDIAYAADHSVAFGLFPTKTDIAFGRTHRLPQKRVNRVSVVGPTSDCNEMPELGCRTTTVVRKPFVEHDRGSVIQHGGILVDNNRRSAIPLSYDEMMDNRPLPDDAVLVQVNWVFDSNTQTQVVNRPNMQEPRPYNALGILNFRDGSTRYFVLGSGFGYCRLTDLLGQSSHSKTIQKTVHIRSFAALANIVQEQLGATSYVVLGTEFRMGGVYREFLDTLERYNFVLEFGDLVTNERKPSEHQRYPPSLFKAKL